MGLGAFVHAEQQLQAQGDACVPPEGKDADVASYDGRPQQVLHGRGAVRVSIKHLREERATTYMRCRTQDVICQIQSKPFSFCNKAAGASQSRILSPETLHQLSLSMRMINCWPSND